MDRIQFKRWSNMAKYHILCIHRSNSLEMVLNLNSLFMWCMYLNCNYELFDSLDTSLGDSIVSFKFLRLHTSNWIFYTKTDLFEWKCCRIPSILVTECSVRRHLRKDESNCSKDFWAVWTYFVAMLGMILQMSSYFMGFYLSVIIFNILNFVRRYENGFWNS